MKLIKSAIVYKAQLPADMGKYLAAEPFAEIQPEQRGTAGFVPVPKVDDFCPAFTGGMAFAVRYDEKVIPASAVKAEVEKRVVAIKADTGRRAGKKERADIKEAVEAEFCRRALVKSAVITCFYDAERGYLHIPTTSEKLAGLITSKLVHALATVKTETINVSDVKMGLTTRMRDWLDDVEGETLPFGPRFELGATAALKRTTEEGTEKIRFDLASDMEGVRRGLTEAFGRYFEVTELGLVHGGTSFRLTHDFHLRGIEYSYEDDAEHDGAAEEWLHAASVQVLEMRSIIDDLIELLGTRPAAQEGGA